MNKKKVMFMISWDGHYSSIRKVETEQQADGYEIFESFTKAKRFLLDDLKQTKDNYAYCIKRVASVKAKDLPEQKLSW